MLHKPLKTFGVCPYHSKVCPPQHRHLGWLSPELCVTKAGCTHTWRKLISNSHHYSPTYNRDTTRKHQGECYHICGSSRYFALQHAFCNPIEKSPFPSFKSAQVTSSHWETLTVGQATWDDNCVTQMAQLCGQCCLTEPHWPRASPLYDVPSPLLPVWIIDSLYEHPILYMFTLAWAWARRPQP